jgi:hypothetical protein
MYCIFCLPQAIYLGILTQNSMIVAYLAWNRNYQDIIVILSALEKTACDSISYLIYCIC